MEQLWKAENMSKATKIFRESRNIRHAAEFTKLPWIQNMAEQYAPLVKKK
jgi:hypothetical protein